MIDSSGYDCHCQSMPRRKMYHFERHVLVVLVLLVVVVVVTIGYPRMHTVMYGTWCLQEVVSCRRRHGCTSGLGFRHMRRLRTHAFSGTQSYRYSDGEDDIVFTFEAVKNEQSGREPVGGSDERPSEGESVVDYAMFEQHDEGVEGTEVAGLLMPCVAMHTNIEDMLTG